MSRRTTTTSAAAALLLLGASALAQPTYDGQAGFRADHLIAGGNVPQVSGDNAWHFGPSNASTPAAMMFGGFDAQGFTNRGLFNFLGRVHLHDPAGSATLRLNNPALRSPYSFGGVALLDPVTGDIIFDAARAGAGLVTVPWELGQPRPDTTYVYPATQGGPDTYFAAGLRFFIDFGDISRRDLTLTVEGQMQVVSEWFFDGGEEGDVANLIPAGFVEAPVSTSVTIIYDPAPGTAVLLSIAGIAGARRRR